MTDEDVYIKLTLTPRNCSRKGYYWIHDILFSDNPFYGTLSVFRQSFEKGYILGRPKKKERKLFGFYVPKYLAHERLSNIFNPMLTPTTANTYGYTFIQDIVYNILKPHEKILKSIVNSGYKLGIATQDNKNDSYFGIYAPLYKKI